MIERKWNRVQSLFLRSKVRFLNFEGGARAGKTTPAIWKLISYALDHPGIKMFACRWTGDAVDMQLKPKFFEECPPEILGRWDAKEECQYFKNGSMLYIRPLKTSDDRSRFSKFTGLTLAVIYIDQPEEVPEDIYRALKMRLSQPGFPQQMFITPNPPAHDHWLVTEFPTNNSIVNHLYIHTSVYDNRSIIGEETIAEMEREYPVGSVMRRRFIDGERGLSIVGKPVYGTVFSRHYHVSELEYLADFPLYESWDFGHKHPAVSWCQLLPNGWWNILGEYLGEAQYIDEAIVSVSALRHSLFPHVSRILVSCDPAGVLGQGVRHTNVSVLNDHLQKLYGPTVGAVYDTAANTPKKRAWCIQQISGYMGRLVQGRPAMQVHPRCVLIADGFEAGYTYDDRQFTGTQLPNNRRPKKDGVYDHLQNTLEYWMISFGEGGMPMTTLREVQSARQQLRELQKEEPDEDEIIHQHIHRRSRAGY